MIIRGEATFVLQEISTLASLEGLRIFPESEAICMENATAGNEASRSTEGALRISPASAGSKNATAGGAASRSTESALQAPQRFSTCLSVPGYAWLDRTDNTQASACWSVSVGGVLFDLDETYCEICVLSTPGLSQKTIEKTQGCRKRIPAAGIRTAT